MKTTLDIDDGLLAAVKELARSRGTTMRAIVEQALRETLTGGPPRPYVLDLPVTTGTRGPSIDIDSNAEIDAYLDARDARR